MLRQVFVLGLMATSVTAFGGEGAAHGEPNQDFGLSSADIHTYTHSYGTVQVPYGYEYYTDTCNFYGTDCGSWTDLNSSSAYTCMDGWYGWGTWCGGCEDGTCEDAYCEYMLTGEGASSGQDVSKVCESYIEFHAEPAPVLYHYCERGDANNVLRESDCVAAAENLGAAHYGNTNLSNRPQGCFYWGNENSGYKVKYNEHTGVNPEDVQAGKPVCFSDVSYHCAEIFANNWPYDVNNGHTTCDEVIEFRGLDCSGEDNVYGCNGTCQSGMGQPCDPYTQGTDPWTCADIIDSYGGYGADCSGCMPGVCEEDTCVDDPTEEFLAYTWNFCDDTLEYSAHCYAGNDDGCQWWGWIGDCEDYMGDNKVADLCPVTCGTCNDGWTLKHEAQYCQEGWSNKTNAETVEECQEDCQNSTDINCNYAGFNPTKTTGNKCLLSETCDLRQGATFNTYTFGMDKCDICKAGFDAGMTCDQISLEKYRQCHDCDLGPEYEDKIAACNGMCQEYMAEYCLNENREGCQPVFFSWDSSWAECGDCLPGYVLTENQYGGMDCELEVALVPEYYLCDAGESNIASKEECSASSEVLAEQTHFSATEHNRADRPAGCFYYVGGNNGITYVNWNIATEVNASFGSWLGSVCVRMV